VVDAMIRQPHSDRALPFREHRLGPGPLEIAAVDYDLGPPGAAYADRVDGDYHTETGDQRSEWNDGRTYRNDGVDIARERDGTPYVTAFEAGEWMQYTLDAAKAGPRAATLIVAADAPATLTLSINDGAAVVVPVRAGAGWQAVPISPPPLLQGTNRLKVAVVNGKVRLKAIRFR
jgi:endoglucanase